MKYEIEVKARISDLAGIKNKLEEFGCVFSQPIHQHDYIYNQKEIDLSHGHKTPVLRVREQDGKNIFTLKQDRENELDCVEKEIEVSDGAVLQEMFEILGYSKTVEVKKTRTKTNYSGYEICLDEVEGLGSFIEVEKISEDDGKTVQRELFDFLKSLGLKEEDRVMVGYDSLMWEKNKKFTH